MSTGHSLRSQYVLALGFASLASIALFGYSALRSHSLGYSYLIWNLFLAWLPLLFAVRLATLLQRKLWSSWEALGWSLVWMFFLPNSFYMISDYVHLRDVSATAVLYDSVMFTSFIYTAVLLGCSSLYLIHVQLRRRLGATIAAGWVGAALLLCSLGIYIGRDLRWNSWDILINPAGLVFDVSDRFLHPEVYPTMFVTVISFTVLLAGVYNVVWRLARLLNHRSVR